MIKAPTGTNDILPDRIPLWRYVEEHARKQCALYGYREIRTPIFESTQLFVRSIGEVTDIVEKEMYTFQPKVERSDNPAKENSRESFTLRPELTAPVVRAYLEHHLDREQKSQKLFYLGPLFRHERPQKGRFRQFHQLGVEALGFSNPLVDVEIINLAQSFLKTIGLDGCVLKINSIGCPECRTGYRNVLRKYFAGHKDQLCANCRERLDRNVFRILDCKNKQCYEIAARAEPINNSLCAGCRTHFDAVLAGLEKNGLSYQLDHHLVRGFDYYTRTIFEITHSALGAQDAVGGGGRYDNLIAELGGSPAGATGWALGLERIILALEAVKNSNLIIQPDKLKVFVASVTQELGSESFALVSELRKKNIAADMDYEGRSLKAQMRLANKQEVSYVIILGPEELTKNAVKLKNMQSGQESEVQRDDLFDLFLKKNMI
ncbi:MAG: histidine--tRNA ligase [Planctomycetota bacterium]